MEKNGCLNVRWQSKIEKESNLQKHQGASRTNIRDNVQLWHNCSAWGGKKQEKTIS